MTLVQLRHLIELAATGSFSQAAVKLHLTQPALSRSIAALEGELGQKLFDRIGHKNELTAFGLHIVQRARALVDEANELRKTGAQLQKGEMGQIRIGMGSGPGALMMTPLLMLMATDYPKAHIDISRGSTTLLVQALRERLLDALILDIRSLQPSPDLKVEALPEMQGAFMCRPSHPLASQTSVRFAQLRQYPIASTPLSDEIARILVERFGPQAHPELLVNLRHESLESGLVLRDGQDAGVDAHLAAGQAEGVGLLAVEHDEFPLRAGQVRHRRDALAHALHHLGVAAAPNHAAGVQHTPITGKTQRQ